MKNTLGQSISVTLFGESHGKAIGAVLDGMAPGIPVDEDFIAHQMGLRRSVSSLSTARKEADKIDILSGLTGNTTCATRIFAKSIWAVVVYRSNNNANANGGVSYANANNGSSNANTNIGCRLAIHNAREKILYQQSFTSRL